MTCDPTSMGAAACDDLIREYIHIDDDPQPILDKDSPIFSEFGTSNSYDDLDDDGRFSSMEYGASEGVEQGYGHGNKTSEHGDTIDDTFYSEPTYGSNGVIKSVEPQPERGGRRRKFAFLWLLVVGAIIGGAFAIAARARREDDDAPDTTGNEAVQQDRDIIITASPTSAPVQKEEETAEPTAMPSAATGAPTVSPIEGTTHPTSQPTSQPTLNPSSKLTSAPTEQQVLSTSSPTAAPSKATPVPTTEPTSFPTRSGSRITVGVYYYANYGQNGLFTPDDYLRDSIGQRPTLGDYSSNDPETVRRHLEWSRKANIGLWVTSYRGEGTPEDVALQQTILKHENLRDMRIALMYESMERVKASEGYTTQRVKNDMQYMCDNYFNRANYYRIDGRPIVVIALTRVLERHEALADVISIMRSIDGCDPYLIGDHAFQLAPDIGHQSVAFDSLDAITNHDVYGGMMTVDNYVGEDTIENYYLEQSNWKLHTVLSKIGFIPSVTPGFNNRAFDPQSSLTPMARKLTSLSDSGSTFRFALGEARRQVTQGTNNLLLVNSFNHWIDDTQIEPVTGAPLSGVESLTQGIDYEAYREQYLNILNERTEGQMR